MAALIQSPLTFNILKMFRTPRNVNSSVDQLIRTVQPVVNTTLLSLLDAPQGSDFINTIALGANNAFAAATAPSPIPAFVYDMSFRGTVALLAGVTIRACPYVVRTAAPGLAGTSSVAPLADPISYTTGEQPLWGKVFPTDAPLLLMPGDFIGLWVSNLVGASPLITMNITASALTS